MSYQVNSILCGGFQARRVGSSPGKGPQAEIQRIAFERQTRPILWRRRWPTWLTSCDVAAWRS
jgi:hypothetical protein